MIPPTEHLIVLVHDVFERGLVHVTIIDTMSERVTGSRLIPKVKTTFLGGTCGKLESVTPEVLSPAMSASTPTDEGKTTERTGGLSMVVESCVVVGDKLRTSVVRKASGTS